MMRARTVISAILVVGLVGSTQALARGKRPRWGPPGGPRFTPPERGGQRPLEALTRQLRKLPDVLEMNEDQRNEYGRIARKHRAAVKRLLAELREQRDKFRGELNEILKPEQRERLEQYRRRMGRDMVPRRPYRPGQWMRGRMRGWGRPGPGEPFRLRPAVVERALDRIELPEEQKDKAMDVVRETREKIRSIEPQRRREAAREILPRMMERVRDVLGPENFERLKRTIHESIGERRGQRRPEPRPWRREAGPRHRGEGRGPGWQRGRDESRRDQRPRLNPRIARRALEGLDLPEEKKHEAMEAVREARERIQAHSPEERRVVRKEILRDMTERIRDVLGPGNFERLMNRVRDLQREQGERRAKQGPRGPRRDREHRPGPPPGPVGPGPLPLW